VDAVAELVAGFHGRAPTGGAIDACATAGFVRGLWVASRDELLAAATGAADHGRVEELAQLALRYLDGRERLFAERIAAGRARDGHGDLLADDVFCLPDGPRVLDCLEFDDRLRYSDTLADVGFLAMDLERLGRSDLARRLLDVYARESHDAWPASLEHLYVAYRAVVRAKVAFLRAADGDDTSTEAARTLLALAHRHLRAGRVRLLVIGGPPASGKSTLARAVGAALGWPVLRSDVVRKQLAGLDAAERRGAPIDEGLYAADWTARTYRALVDEARTHLELGESVVLDASWSDPRWRGDARGAAETTASDLLEVCCTAPEAVRRERAARRLEAGTDASDATPDLAIDLGRRFAPWSSARAVDGTEPVGALSARVIELLER
jgi:predicted kinase